MSIVDHHDADALVGAGDDGVDSGDDGIDDLGLVLEGHQVECAVHLLDALGQEAAVVDADGV